MNTRLDEYVSTHRDRAVLTPSMGPQVYLSVMSHADAVIGNSSSGLLEAPIVLVPTVNIGDRQKGRIRASSVLDCAAETGAIIETIRLACSDEFQTSLDGLVHPCEQRDTDLQIVQRLEQVSLDGVLMKAFYDVPR